MKETRFLKKKTQTQSMYKYNENRIYKSIDKILFC